MEEGRVIQRPCVDRMIGVLTDDSAEDQPSAACTAVTHRIATTEGLRDAEFRRAPEPYRACRESEERDQTRSGRFAAIPTAAVTLVLRLAPCLIPYGAAEASTDIDCFSAHAPRLLVFHGDVSAFLI